MVDIWSVSPLSERRANSITRYLANKLVKKKPTDVAPQFL